MPVTESSFSRSVFSMRREMEGNNGASVQEAELDLFQKQVAHRFRDLLLATALKGDEFLSLSWIHQLLDGFICCQEEFRAILFNNRVHLCRPPMDRLIGDYFERSVKALDVCNAIRDGIELIRHWHKYLEIVLTALDFNQRAIGEGQFRRAKRALTDLTIAMLDDKDSTSVLAQHRNRSFGRSNVPKDPPRPHAHFRSLSWSVSRSWSAAKQLQAISANLAPPRGNDLHSTNSLANAVFTMSSLLLFVMWTLVAAIPCQDRGLQMHFNIPRHFTWAASIMSLHDRIIEESKKRERRNASGLMKEIHQTEKCARHITELADSIQFPLTEQREGEVKQSVKELTDICEAMKGGLDPLERQVSEVFHRILRNRTEGMDCLSKPNHGE